MRRYSLYTPRGAPPSKRTVGKAKRKKRRRQIVRSRSVADLRSGSGSSKSEGRKSRYSRTPIDSLVARSWSQMYKDDLKAKAEQANRRLPQRKKVRLGPIPEKNIGKARAVYSIGDAVVGRRRKSLEGGDGNWYNAEIQGVDDDTIASPENRTYMLQFLDGVVGYCTTEDLRVRVEVKREGFVPKGRSLRYPQYRIGDRVEVRNASGSQWHLGVVADTDRGLVMVKRDDWDACMTFTYKYIRWSNAPLRSGKQKRGFLSASTRNRILERKVNNMVKRTKAKPEEVGEYLKALGGGVVEALAEEKQREEIKQDYVQRQVHVRPREDESFFQYGRRVKAATAKRNSAMADRRRAAKLGSEYDLPALNRNPSVKELKHPNPSVQHPDGWESSSKVAWLAGYWLSYDPEDKVPEHYQNMQEEFVRKCDGRPWAVKSDSSCFIYYWALLQAWFVCRADGEMIYECKTRRETPHLLRNWTRWSGSVPHASLKFDCKPWSVTVITLILDQLKRHTKLSPATSKLVVAFCTAVPTRAGGFFKC